MLTIGSIAWKALGWAMPGLSPALFYGVAALLVIGLPAGGVWMHMRGEVKAATVAERAACDTRIAENEAASSRALSDLLAKIAADEPDETDKTAAQLCKGSKFCRDGKK